jgi:ketosteroid isomerase-like protein
MSEENVEAVRAVYERWGEGDFRASVPLFDPHVVLVMRPEFPDAGTYLGADEIAGYTRGLLDAWTDFTIAAEEILPAGDSVVVAVRQHGVGTTSGAPTEIRYFHVWSFRAGRVVRIESIRERADALDAVGLRE